MSRRLALLIGNVRYQDGRLHSPISGKTFTALADVLEDSHTGRFDEVFVLVNKPAVEVQLAIAEFFEESRSPDDLLLIYFAGHALHNQGKPYLACWDTFTEHYLDATTVQAEYVKRRFSLQQARHKLVILDCTLSPLLDGDSLPEDTGWLQRAFQGAGMTVLAAARPYIPTEPPAHSPFTPTLIEALRTGEVRLDGAELTAAVAWFNQLQAPPVPPEVETPPEEAPLPVVLAEEPEIVVASETAVVETPIAEIAVAEATAISATVIEEVAAETPLVPETAVEPETAVVPATPTPTRSYKRYAIPALVILLLLLAVGSLYGNGFFEQTAVSPTTTSTSAAVAAQPTRTSTSTAAATQTAVPTHTAAATHTTPPQPTISPSPIPSSPTPLIPSSPIPLNVQIARQLVYLRGGPAINFRIVDYLVQGTAVTVLGRTESGDWFNVELADGRTGWVYNEMAEPPAGVDLDDIPVVATIPAPINEFHDFVAQPTDEGLTVTIGHVYAGKQGPATFRAELLPETNLIQPTYEDGQELGLGRLVVRFARVGEGEYVSTAVRLCMGSTSGTLFFCETYPVVKEW